MGSPVDKEVQDALDRLEHFLANGDPRANPMVDIATVRSALEQLREERDALGNALAREQAKPGGSFDQWALLQAAEAEVQRLREGLREIAEWDGRSAEIHGNRGVREYARALLSASPDGGGAK